MDLAKRSSVLIRVSPEFKAEIQRVKLHLKQKYGLKNAPSTAYITHNIRLDGEFDLVGKKRKKL